MKIVIVGAVAGGATVAAQIRRSLPDSEIMLYGRDPVLGYGTCGMPYVVGGLIDEESKIAGPPSKKNSGSSTGTSMSDWSTKSSPVNQSNH